MTETDGWWFLTRECAHEHACFVAFLAGEN